MAFARWWSLAIGLLAMIVSGNLYSFSVFSQALKSQIGLSNTGATTIITVGNFGLCFATIAGWFYDVFGPRLTSLMGGIMGSGSYIAVMYFSKHPPSEHWLVIIFSVLYFLIGQGSIFIYMAGFMQCKNFPQRHRGKVVGLLDCGFGLSAAIFSQIYGWTYGRTSDPSKQNIYGYFIFLAVVMAIVSALGVLSFRVLIVDEDQFTAEIQTDALETPMNVKFKVGDAVAVQTTEGKANNYHGIICESAKDGQYPVCMSDKDLGTMYFFPDQLSLDITGKNLFMSPGFWFVFIFFIMIQGCGLVVMNNIGYMITALQYSSKVTVVANTILPLTSAICRITTGLIADDLYRLSRMGALSLTAILMCIAHLLFALLMSSSEYIIHIAAGLTGAAFGVSWCLTPLVVADQFGVEHFGFNWGVMITASALGPLPYQPIVNKIYNDHLTPPNTDCYGSACYMVTFIITSSSMILAFVFGIVAAKLFRRKYQYF